MEQPMQGWDDSKPYWAVHLEYQLGCVWGISCRQHAFSSVSLSWHLITKIWPKLFLSVLYGCCRKAMTAYIGAKYRWCWLECHTLHLQMSLPDRKLQATNERIYGFPDVQPCPSDECCLSQSFGAQLREVSDPLSSPKVWQNYKRSVVLYQPFLSAKQTEDKWRKRVRRLVGISSFQECHWAEFCSFPSQVARHSLLHGGTASQHPRGKNIYSDAS